MIPVTAKITFIIAVVGLRGGPGGAGGAAVTGTGFDQLSLLLWEIRIIYVAVVGREASGTKQSELNLGSTSTARPFISFSCEVSSSERVIFCEIRIMVSHSDKTRSGGRMEVYFIRRFGPCYGSGLPRD